VAPGGHPGGGGARRDRVDGDVSLGECGSQIAHHGRDGGLACRIQGVVMDRQAHTDRGAEHDPAAVGHRGHRGLCEKQLSGHVGLKEEIEVGLGDRLQRSEVLDAGVADQQVQAAELRYHCADQLMGLRGVADVAEEGRRGPPLVGQFADECVGGSSIGSIVHRDGGPLGGQAPHDRGADPAATSGDQDPLARQGWCRCHGAPSFSRCLCPRAGRANVMNIPISQLL
jgi:hypothetical protein